MTTNHRGCSGGNRQRGISLTVFPMSGPAQPQGYATDATRRDMSRDSRVANRRRVTRRDATHPLRGVALSRPLRCWEAGVRGSPAWCALGGCPVAGMPVGPSVGCALRGARSPDISPRGEDSESEKLLLSETDTGLSKCFLNDIRVLSQVHSAQAIYEYAPRWNGGHIWVTIGSSVKAATRSGIETAAGSSVESSARPSVEPSAGACVQSPARSGVHSATGAGICTTVRPSVEAAAGASICSSTGTGVLVAYPHCSQLPFKFLKPSSPSLPAFVQASQRKRDA